MMIDDDEQFRRAAMKPLRSILNADFVYTPAVETDLRKTFARERKRLAKLAEAEKARAAAVTPIRKQAAK